MKIFKDKHTLQKEILKTKGISFIPTMGGLHKGHISLIKESKKSGFKTLVSIFVNPKQFNKKSDFRSYPRSAKKDIRLLKKLKINYLYTPVFKDICPLCKPPIVGINDIGLLRISFCRLILSLNIFISLQQ